MGSIMAMVPADSRVGETPAAAARLDPQSAEWLQALAGTGEQREAALARLHGLLVRIAQGEVRRRGPRLRITGPELDDLAHQAAADALVAVTGKLGQFRGESRFTTWAYKFVMFEVSAKVGRHFWRHPNVPLDAEDWDRLPGNFGFDPAREAEWRDLLGALRRAVDEVLTARQRAVFVAIVLNQVPLDTLVIELSSSRNAIYTTLFDARRKLVVGKTVYGRDREVDVLFRDARNGNRLAVEAKYQRVAGTADEKLPYAVLNQQTLPLPGVIVYGGGGFHLGALHWLCANTKATDIARLPEWLTVFFAL